jgi:predicted Rossmann fold nucleotide-binding protein DprA/Smf involved in DNA uptake
VHAHDLARALRDAGIQVIGGFHSPMEKECLELLLRGPQSVVICPAQGLERMRLPAARRAPLAEARLLVLSPFPARHQRPTAAWGEQRNRFVAMLADEIFVAHASAGSRTERLCTEIMAEGKQTSTHNFPENTHLM